MTVTVRVPQRSGGFVRRHTPSPGGPATNSSPASRRGSIQSYRPPPRALGLPLGSSTRPSCLRSRAVTFRGTVKSCPLRGHGAAGTADRFMLASAQSEVTPSFRKAKCCTEDDRARQPA